MVNIIPPLLKRTENQQMPPKSCKKKAKNAARTQENPTRACEILSGPCGILLDPCGILVGFLRNSCGIIVGFLWDFGRAGKRQFGFLEIVFCLFFP